MTWEGLNPPYATIVVDPPWDYPDKHRWPSSNGPSKNNAEGRVVYRRGFTYSTMTVDEIAGMDVGAIAAKDAWLALWTTNRHLFACPSILDAWGFTYRQTLVWHKTKQPSPYGGTLAPNCAEFLLIAARGRPRVVARVPSSVFALPREAAHSRKPQPILDAIATALPGPYVELFARQPRLGWDHWGYGYEEAAS